jgi:hypothetical protein
MRRFENEVEQIGTRTINTLISSEKKGISHNYSIDDRDQYLTRFYFI